GAPPGALPTWFRARPPVEPSVAAATASLTPSTGEEVRTARKFEGATWSRVVNISFVPGKKADAIRIIQDYLRPASVASSTPQPLAYEHVTGEYDITAIWELTEGTDSLNWEVSPAQVAWRTALAERLGGFDKADEMLATYRSYIRKTETNILQTLELKVPETVETSAAR
ncbi:MAG: hypothetical protein AAGG01_24590, partial [Planctomycetota bacterium]